jgi:hypothetical protein
MNDTDNGTGDDLPKTLSPGLTDPTDAQARKAYKHWILYGKWPTGLQVPWDYEDWIQYGTWWGPGEPPADPTPTEREHAASTRHHEWKTSKTGTT